MKLNNKIVIILILFTQIIFVNIALAKEAEVIFVDIEDHGISDAEEIKLACDLLGVRFRTHFVRTTDKKEILKSSKELYDKEVLILAGRVLKYFNKDIVSLFVQSQGKTKILILDINSDTDIEDLKIWSENMIKNFRQFDSPSPTTSIRVVENDQISKELGGLEYPLIGSGAGMVNGLELTNFIGAVSLIEVVDDSGKRVCPVFVKTDSVKRSVFYLTSWEKVISTKTNSLLKIMPILMFLKHSFGDRCWHGSNDYANLTIDDPWLREPYGYLSFADLCREAKKNRFHVTIGFIPYNYQKSHNGAIEIFRQCQQNLSIALHGNNHDLSEFRSSGNARLTDKILSDIHPDEKNILQALYRMDAFKQKTGLSYDQVMIFPRGDFTKESLALLKKHNFLMTVNSTKPSNAADVKNDVDRLRGITLEFANFPMVIRHGISDRKNDKRALAEAKSWIQMRLFLDLPVLLYTHHDFFKDGADEFNAIAGVINTIQPDVLWTSLGNIAKYMYLQKRVDNRKIEILAYSSDLVIRNKYPFNMKYVVKKQEDFVIPIQSVEVDGVKHEYIQDGNHIRTEIEIELGCEKNIRILYYSDYQVGSFTYSDTDLQVTLIRTLSDFRDLYLSKVPFGDKIVKVFYLIGGGKKTVIGMIGIIIMAGAMGIYFVWHIKNKNSKKGF